MENQEELKASGYLDTSLARNNKTIRADRGEAIKEDLEIIYKRGVEDIEIRIKRLSRERLNMFDFSPTNAQSLVLVKDLDAQDIHQKDMVIRAKLRNEKINLGLAKEAYNFLIGEAYLINPDEQ